MEQDIFAAIAAGDKEAVAKLIDEHPELVHAKNAEGVTALMQARYEFKLEIVEILRQAADELDIFQAAALGDVAQLRKLLAGNPALTKAFSGDGATALHFACFFNKPEAAEELIRSGADVNMVSRNTMRVTPLHSAAATRNAELVKLILRAGADPNPQQQSGYTALHSAAFHNDAEMARALLDAGADRNLRSDDGLTAVELATQKNHGDVAAVLAESDRTGAKR